ncbi:MAG: polysaccharide deacetylase family protein [Clostridia bacterium]|nr:polysaccharide deacetylase family protein [Clostridia bacterium]
MRKKVLAVLIAALFFLALVKGLADDEMLSRRTVYITIDDGPTLNTPHFLELLEKYNAKATFFVLQERIIKYPDYIRAIVYSGHAIGLHGTSHDKEHIYATSTSPLDEMNAANNSLYELMGFKSPICRTPYGSNPYMSKKQASILIGAGYKIWDWDVDPRDGIGKSVPAATILSNMKKGLAKTPDDAVILFHDRLSTLHAFESVLKYLSECGYDMRAIDYNKAPHNFVDRLK